MDRERFLWDIYDDRCPTRDVLARLADKWALLVLGRLESGPARFNRLRREIRGISQKMLTQTLRKLERDGLVSRKNFNTVPAMVEYSLTALGKTLTEAVTVLAKWVVNNIEAVQSAQLNYDRNFRSS